MRQLLLMGIALLGCAGCHCCGGSAPTGFGMLGSNPGNGVATAPPVYATPPQYVAVPQAAPVAAAPVAAQIVAAPAPAPVIMQAAPIAAPTQVVQQQPVTTVTPTAYYQSNACQPCQPACQPVCQPATCCTPCQ
jgi:hypothetical protein